MVVTEKSFDEIIKEHKSAIKTGRKMMLDILLQEIITYKYETFSQLKGAIETHLDMLGSDTNG